MKLDSLSIIHDTFYIKGAEAFDLVNKVDAFYSSAWSKLILIGSLGSALITIAFLLFQNYKIKTDRAQIKRHLLKDVEEMWLEKKKIYDDEIKKINDSNEAALMHLQGNMLITMNQPFAALVNFFSATIAAIKSENYQNAQNEIVTIISIISNEAITKKLLLQHNINIDNFMKSIASLDDKGIVTNNMMQLNDVYNKMK